MCPEYVNVFGVRKATDKEGNVLEVTLDASCNYVESTVTMGENGMETNATPTIAPIASLIMNRQSAVALCNLLIKTLSTEKESV